MYIKPYDCYIGGMETLSLLLHCMYGNEVDDCSSKDVVGEMEVVVKPTQKLYG